MAKLTLFEIDTIDTEDDSVVVVICGKFTKLLSERLTLAEDVAQRMGAKHHPSILALAHAIKQSGQILSGMPVERFPHLKEAVLSAATARAV